MGNEELISEYIDLSAVSAQTDAFLGQIKRLNEAYDQLASKSLNLGGLSSSKEITAQIKELQSQLAALTKQKEDLLNVDLKAQKVATESARTKQQEAKATAEQAKAEATVATAKNKTRVASEASTRATKAEDKAIEDLSNDYKQLSLAYNEAALRAKNLALQQGGNTVAAKAAAAEANALGAKLKEVDASVGQFQRNVGDYANKFAEGFSKAFGFLRQAAAIIPGLGLSGIFLLAFEAITSVVQALGFFSNATEKAAKDQQFLNEATSKAIDLQKEYEDATRRNYGTVTRGIENELLYAKARGDSAEKILALEKKIAEQRQATASEDFFNTGGEDHLDKVKVKFNEAEQALTAFYEAGKEPGMKYGLFAGGIGKDEKFDQEKYSQKESQLKAEFELTKKQYANQKAITEEFYNANAEVQEKSIELAKANGEQLKNYYSKESTELAQYYIAIEKGISQSVEGGVRERLKARQMEFDETKALDTKAYHERLRDALETLNEVKNKPGVSDKDKANAQRKYDADIGTIQSEFYTGQKVDRLRYEADINSIIATSRKKQHDNDKADNDLFEAEEKARHEARIKLQQKNADDRSTITSASRDNELEFLNRQYGKGLISTEKYQKEKYELEKKYEIRTLQDTLDNAQFLIDNAKEYGADVLKQEKIIADARKKISDQLTNELLSNETKLRDERKKITSQVVAGIGELVDNGYDREKNAIQDQIDTLNKKKATEVEAVNNSIGTAEDKAAQIALINDRADDQQQALEKRQKDSDVKKAEFDKIIAEIQIGGQTAQAVQALSVKAAEARAQGALLAANPATAAYAGIAYASAGAIAAQIPIVIAQGIIAAGLIAAKPIPRYRTGIENHPGGTFVGGDGGKPEFVLMPSGESFITASRDTLYDAPKGTRVFPDANNLPDDIMRMSMKPPRQMPAAMDNSMLIANTMNRGFNRLTNAVINKQETHFGWSNGELQKSHKNAEAWTHYKNRMV